MDPKEQELDPEETKPPERRIVAICMTCKRIRVEGEWVEDTREPGDDASLSHAFCPGCLEVEKLRIDADLRQLRF